MNQRAVVTASMRGLCIEFPPNSMLFPRSFSTSMRHANIHSRFSVQNTHLRLASHILRNFFTNVSSLNSVAIRSMSSSSKEPPDFTKGNLSRNSPSVHKEDSGREIQNEHNSQINYFTEIAKEKEPDLNKELLMKTSFTNTAMPPQLGSISLKKDEVKDSGKPDDWNDILNRWYTKYQDFIGITDLKRAQDKVTELSEGLLGTQSRRRNLQAELEELQAQLTLNHQRITKAELYSEEHQMLFDQARDMNSRLKDVRSEFAHCERLERDTFTHLSAAIRDCHERERTQAEQSKYWSIIASIVSAALASVITSINNWVRIREIKDHVSSNNQQLLEGYQKMHEDVVGAVTSSMSGATTNNVNNSGSEHPGVSPLELAGKDATSTSTFGEELLRQIEAAVTKETKYIHETIAPRLDAIAMNLRLILEGDGQIVESVITGNVDNETAMILPSLSQSELEKSSEVNTIVVEYSYFRIATAMAVGAGLGIFATAFFLGSFSGGGIK